MNVLIVEDMENMFNSIRGILRLLKFGRKFMYARSGAEALQTMRTNSIDLVLLDNKMPGMSGLEVLEAIRQDRYMRETPVIMITALAEKEFITKAAESEIDAYILKPITVGLLKEKIPQVIEKANNPSPMFEHLKNAALRDEQGDLAGAIGEALLAMEANPRSSRPLREIGYYHFKCGDFGQAEDYLLRAARKNPIDVVAMTHLGELYLKQDKIDSALKFFTKAMDISPRHYERALSFGKTLILKQMAARAAPVFHRVFELAREPLAIKEDVAKFCLAAGAKEYAAKLLGQIVEQDTARHDLLFQLGLLFEEGGDIEGALIYFARAERLDAANMEIKLHLAKGYLAQGMVIRAERPLKAILKIKPDHREARTLLRTCV